MSMLTPLLTNILKGWKTTLLGVVLLAAIITSIFIVDTVTWSDALLCIVLALALILCPKGVRKALLNFLQSKAATILVLLTCSMLLSCTGSKESATTTIKSTGTVKGIVNKYIKADTAGIAKNVKEMEPGRIYIQESERAGVSITTDKAGNITAKGTCKPEIIRDTIEIDFDLEVPVPVPCKKVHATKQEEEKQTPTGWVFRNIVAPGAFVLATIVVFAVVVMFMVAMIKTFFSKPSTTHE